MELMHRTPLDATREAFDAVASVYAQSNAVNATLCDMRARTLAAVRASVSPGARLLDLGCGPGVDAERLAAEGYRVTAIDWSPAMVSQARARVAFAAGRASVRHLGIHELDRLAPARFDASYSNLGPLNCVPDLAAAARSIAARLLPGGTLVASVIGRICPWEMALYARRGDWRRLRVRFARGPVPVPLDGRIVWTRYYTPRAFIRTFSNAGFRVQSCRTLGLLVPPPYMQAFADRHRAVIDALQRAEDVVAGWPGVRACGDHFLVVLRKW